MSGFLDALDREVADLEQQLAAHPAFKKLTELRRVRAMYVGEGGNQPAPNQTASSQPPRSNYAPTGKRGEVLEAALQFLRGQAQPVRTGAILDHLKSIGVQVTGSVPANTVSSLLSKSDDAKSLGWHVGWVATKKSSTGDANKPYHGASPVNVERQVDFLTEPEAQGREAGPGGGT